MPEILRCQLLLQAFEPRMHRCRRRPLAHEETKECVDGTGARAAPLHEVLGQPPMTLLAVPELVCDEACDIGRHYCFQGAPVLLEVDEKAARHDAVDGHRLGTVLLVHQVGPKRSELRRDCRWRRPLPLCQSKKRVDRRGQMHAPFADAARPPTVPTFVPPTLETEVGVEMIELDGGERQVSPVEEAEKPPRDRRVAFDSRSTVPLLDQQRPEAVDPSLGRRIGSRHGAPPVCVRRMHHACCDKWKNAFAPQSPLLCAATSGELRVL
jgi:hypothetical protein